MSRYPGTVVHTSLQGCVTPTIDDAVTASARRGDVDRHDAARKVPTGLQQLAPPCRRSPCRSSSPRAPGCSRRRPSSGPCAACASCSSAPSGRGPSRSTWPLSWTATGASRAPTASRRSRGTTWASRPWRGCARRSCPGEVPLTMPDPRGLLQVRRQGRHHLRLQHRELQAVQVRGRRADGHGQGQAGPAGPARRPAGPLRRQRAHPGPARAAEARRARGHEPRRGADQGQQEVFVVCSLARPG